ncbi:RDD family protein [Embleya sp. NBC_00896]|uniref:RDD family protein n=1 Tax=Embleya sp. NBC_00896 TaxID=2975961 RepID=UPI00386F8576|nr:RDD family protein [Embleya sp. NBC_00896]
MDDKTTASRTQAPGAAGEEFGYRGKRLGLPEDGPNSMASTQRRLVALVIDWGICYLIALSFMGGGDINAAGTSWGTLVLFAAENLLLVSTIGWTFGKRIMGIRVVSVTRATLSPLAVVVRTLLLCLVIPPAIYDRDGRGFHDKSVGTAVVRA